MALRNTWWCAQLVAKERQEETVPVHHRHWRGEWWKCWKCWKCWTDGIRWLLFFCWLDLPRLSAVMLHAYTFSWFWTAMLTLCIRRRTLFSELGGACWAQMGASKDFKLGWAAVQQTSGIHQIPPVWRQISGQTWSPSQRKQAISWEIHR